MKLTCGDSQCEEAALGRCCRLLGLGSKRWLEPAGLHNPDSAAEWPLGLHKRLLLLRWQLLLLLRL